jgi:hypothetical protein
VRSAPLAVAVASIVFVVACGQSEERAVDHALAPLLPVSAVSAVAPRGSAASSAAQLEPTLARIPALAAHLGREGSLRIERDRARLDDARAPLGAEVALADGAATISRAGHASPLVTVHLAGPARGARPVVRGARLESAEVAASTDRAVVLERDRFEDLWILRGPEAPSTLAYRLEVGLDVDRVALRASPHGSTLALLDARGRELLATLPIVAFDAHGVQRAPRVALEGDLVTLSLDTAGLEFPVVVDPAWVASAHVMSVPRSLPTATLLADGRVLVAGGYGAARSTAEIYDPATDAFGPPSTLSSPHAEHGASRLPSGDVVVFGGFDSTYLSTAERWDHTTGLWSSTGAMSARRNGFASATLADGRAVVLGGNNGSLQFLVELYDEASHAFAKGPSLNTPRQGHAAVVLEDGSVFTCGGLANPIVKACERWAPSTAAWTARAPMAIGRDTFLLVAIPGNRVVALGGEFDRSASNTITASAELYDVAADTWTSLPSMASPRTGAVAVRLGDGHLIVAGGTDGLGHTLSSTEIFDPATLTWSVGSALTVARSSAAAISLDATSAVVIGGSGSATSLSSAELFRTRPIASACASGAECASGFCADGVCCNAACTASCVACDVGGSVGTCVNVASGPPHAARSCAPYASCAAGACVASCAKDADCTASAWCSASACVPKKALGAACGADGQCTSGHCADGVCCNAACTGACEACDVTTGGATAGTCSVVTGTPRGSRPACGGAGAGTSCGARCDGVKRDACVFPPADVTVCGGVGCASGIETHSSSCDGAGLCRDVPKACVAYACGGSSCNTTCASNAACAAGYYCKSSACVPIEGLGTACTDASTCATGHCVDGACCGTASCAADESCGLVAHAGTCAKVPGASCTVGATCGSGVCIDGVCCDRACDGVCEACDAAGSRGHCQPIAGRPHGTRAGCPSEGAGVCRAHLCDGATAASCAAWAGADVPCRDASCTDGVAVEAAGCDAAGACGALKKTPCAGYRCDDAGLACRTTCATDAQCADGYACTAGACKPKTARCSDDGLSILDGAGLASSCTPFVCKGGACVTACATTDDCVPGDTCDVASGKCAGGGPSATSSSGGCVLGSGGSSGSGGGGPTAALALAALLLGVVGRLRRRRS